MVEAAISPMLIRNWLGVIVPVVQVNCWMEVSSLWETEKAQLWMVTLLLAASASPTMTY